MFGYWDSVFKMFDIGFSRSNSVFGILYSDSVFELVENTEFDEKGKYRIFESMEYQKMRFGIRFKNRNSVLENLE